MNTHGAIDLRSIIQMALDDARIQCKAPASGGFVMPADVADMMAKIESMISASMLVSSFYFDAFEADGLVPVQPSAALTPHAR